MNKMLLDKMQQRLTSKEFRYATNNNIISLNVDIGEAVGVLRIEIHVLDNAYVCYASLNNKAAPDKFCNISEYLHRANLGLIFGNFEMDFSDGEIRYKYSIEIENANNIPNQTLDKCILLPCVMFKRYGSGILSLLFSDGDPQELIKEIENDQEK
ncbi:MAG: hypothetical protein E7535_06500 [Ruminococcaceae bacterium]|nr:hypothetical protein [Oscillospiraceae bacterium]